MKWLLAGLKFVAEAVIDKFRKKDKEEKDPSKL